ncbi:MAG TPA: sortase [Verrucomicrobiae bacterium]|nr:sortase [Verrucomicrobiae bacterium]
MIISKKLLVVGSTATVLGLAGIAPSAYYRYRDSHAVRASAYNPPTVTTPTVVAAPQVITGKPSRLVIPGLKLDLSVADGVYDTKSGRWTLSNDKVHYALMTMQPNDQQGNTLIYGHYRPGVFATLKSIKLGAEVRVVTDNGYTFAYTFREAKTIEPSDTSILSYEGKPQLTLQTCTGAFMQNRQLFSFDFVGVTKN